MKCCLSKSCQQIAQGGNTSHDLIQRGPVSQSGMLKHSLQYIPMKPMAWRKIFSYYCQPWPSDFKLLLIISSQLPCSAQPCLLQIVIFSALIILLFYPRNRHNITRVVIMSSMAQGFTHLTLSLETVGSISEHRKKSCFIQNYMDI